MDVAHGCRTVLLKTPLSTGHNDESETQAEVGAGL